MPFIRGAWIQLHAWDERYHDYYCCPKHTGLYCNVPDDPKDPPYYSCYFTNQRKICNMYTDDPEYMLLDGPRGIMDPIRPDWCPLNETV